jgi:hypothetical protein
MGGWLDQELGGDAKQCRDEIRLCDGKRAATANMSDAALPMSSVL